MPSYAESLIQMKFCSDNLEEKKAQKAFFFLYFHIYMKQTKDYNKLRKDGVFNDIFFYYPDGTTTLPFYRALIKYEGTLNIQPGTGLVFTKNNEEYAILIGKNISLDGTSFVCGVAL